MGNKLLLFLCALFSLLCTVNYISVNAEDTEQVEFVTFGTEEFPEDNTQEDIEDGSSDNSTDASVEVEEESTKESTEDDFDFDFQEDEESNETESEPEETTEQDSEESTEQNQVVNCSYSSEDLKDLEDKVDLTNDLLKYIMYSIWSCTGLYMGSKLIRGLFNE